MMNHDTSFRRLALAASIACACIALPALADGTSDSDAKLIADATVPANRLAERYAEFVGSEDESSALVRSLRNGSDFTLIETVSTTHSDGTLTTREVETLIENPNGKMGYGEINIALSLAQALVTSGEYPDLQSALTGLTTTVTNADGTTTTTTIDGVLAMRADGMGWGSIAKRLDLNLGKLVSASNKSEQAAASSRSDKSRDKERVAKTDRGQSERAGRSERPDRADRPQRPDRPERGRP